MSGPTSTPSFDGSPIFRLREDFFEPLDQRLGDALVDDEPAERRAALSGRSRGGEGDGARRELEIGASA